jgi:aldehyde dehydrogenase (NAD+)
MDAGTNIGPVTTPAQYKKILDYISIAKDEGARCVLGGVAAKDLPGWSIRRADNLH